MVVVISCWNTAVITEVLLLDTLVGDDDDDDSYLRLEGL